MVCCKFCRSTFTFVYTSAAYVYKFCARAYSKLWTRLLLLYDFVNICVCVPRRSTPGQPGGRWNWEKGGICQFISATLLVFLLCWQFGDTEDTMFHCASEVTTLWRYTNLFIVIIITAICLLFTAEQTCCWGLQKCIRVFIPLCHVSMLFQQTVDLLSDMMLVH